MAGMLARVPMRVRVAAAFTGAMALVLAALGLFLYVRLGDALEATVERGLRSRAADLTAIARQVDVGSPAAARRLADQDDDVAQILDARGRVLAAAPRLGDRAVLTAAEAGRAARGRILLTHSSSPLDEEPVRLLATPVHHADREMVVVVGASLDDVGDARRELGALLLLGGPFALLLASLAGYGAAARPLRAVDVMRRRAREIQAGAPDARLPVPPSRDEIARLGETLNEMLDRLADAYARERRFVAEAGHELRTPLAILKTELELALRDATDVAEFRAALESATEETDRLARLAEDLLVIARADQGRLPVRPAPVPAVAVLASVGTRFAGRAAERGLTLRTDGADGLELLADRLRLDQALGNLVDNALRHGGGTVAVAAERRGDRVELHVRDEGPGFPDGFAADAFERFTRADEARGRGGAGLGLAIVDAIARGHGGSAHACNRPEGGADVWIDLPAPR